GFARITLSTASRPLRKIPTTSMSFSSLSHRDIRPRTTTASSTIITRMRGSAELSAAGSGRDIRYKLNSHRKMARPSGLADVRSDQADFLEFRLDDLLVERLHDVFVGTRVHRPRDMREIVFGRAEYDLRAVSMRHSPERPQELVAVHYRHVPVQEDRVRHFPHAYVERLAAIGGFHDGE